MAHVATVTSKRQFTIPADLYKEMGLSKGDKLLIKKDGNSLKIIKMLDLVEEISGSVSVSANLKGADLDKAVNIAKRKHFCRK